MATAVIELDLFAPPREITGLDRFSAALVLLRFKQLPIGQLTLPVVDDRLVIKRVYSDILIAAGSALQDCWLREYLHGEDTLAEADQISPSASIVVCTHDRPEDLRRCLDALMNLPDDGQEYLVIDNCPSSDATRTLVGLYPRVRYVLEPRLGLNVARNRALQEAKHEVVAFTDDDATPDANWLRALLRNFGSPLVSCVTGLTLPLELETDGQEAFEQYSPFAKGFNRILHTQGTHNPLSTGGVGAGANMAVRRTATSIIGYFDEALDAGTPTKSGGDHEFFARILLNGYHIVYEPAALSWHRHRRTLAETRNTIRGYGTGVYAFWTRLLVVEKELEVLRLPWRWFRGMQFPSLIGSLLRRAGSQPLNLVLAELQGCCAGPFAYWRSRRRLKRHHS